MDVQRRYRTKLRQFFSSAYLHICIFAQLLLLCVTFASCENSDEAIEEWTKKVELKEEGKNVEAFFSQNGTLKAKLHAPFMIRAQRDTVYTEFPKSLHVDFYDSLAKRES